MLLKLLRAVHLEFVQIGMLSCVVCPAFRNAMQRDIHTDLTAQSILVLQIERIFAWLLCRTKRSAHCVDGSTWTLDLVLRPWFVIPWATARKWSLQQVQKWLWLQQQGSASWRLKISASHRNSHNHTNVPCHGYLAYLWEAHLPWHAR